MQRDTFVREILDEATIDGRELVAVRPRPTYQPLFAYAVGQGVVCGRGDWAKSEAGVPLLKSGIKVLGIERWLERLAA